MKKKQKQSTPISRKIRFPKQDEMFAVVIEMSGGSRMRALCADNKTRMVRIGGKPHENIKKHDLDNTSCINN